MNRIIFPVPRIFLAGLLVMLSNSARADTFGGGGNTFTIDFVTVGDAGNPNDSGTTGLYHSVHGAVSNSFAIGVHEVSEDMMTRANTLGNLGITTLSRGSSKPVTNVSWNEAARFVNWLNTSQGYSTVYKFTLQPGDVGYSGNAELVLWTTGDAGYNPANPYRNGNARYFLPSENEWYKAAFYSGSGATYYDYATESDTAPTGVANGTAAGTVVY